MTTLAAIALYHSKLIREFQHKVSAKHRFYCGYQNKNLAKIV